MKKGITYLFISVTILLFSTIIQAQKNVGKLDYDKYSKEIRDEVWNWKRPEFENRKIPEQYAKSSAVVMAVHHEMVLDAKNRFSAMAFLATHSKVTNQVLYYTNTMRKMVKINDKSAVDDYSQLSFQEYFATQGYWTKAAAMTVVGVRIIKPDGTIKEIDTSEEISLEGTKSDRSRKLAIADLQAGDIVDYFVHYTEQMDNRNISPLTFLFASTEPILSYSIHATIDKRLTTEYRSVNGAPDFEVKKNKNGEFELNTKIENIAPIENEKWLSVGRQFPSIHLVVLYNSSDNLYHPESARKSGLYKNLNYNEIVNDYKWNIFDYSQMYKFKNDAYYGKINDLVKAYKKKNPKISNDSLACFIYYAVQHFYINDWDLPIIEVGNDRNYYNIKEIRFISCLSEIFKHYKIKTNLVFAPSAYGLSLNNIASIDDLTAFVVTQSSNPIYFAAPTVFSNPNRIPYFCEGQDAVLFKVNKYSKGDFKAKDRNAKIKTPLSTAAQNKRTDDIQITMDMSNPSELQFNRTAHVSGHIREQFQKMLLLYEQFEVLNRKAFGIKKSLFDEMSDKRKTRSLVQEYEAAFAKAREKQNDYFKEEIKMMHDEEAKEMQSFKVLNIGMPITKSNFDYNLQYIMDGFVKKAGNNYTIDVGKLAGTQLQLEPKERTRTIDVYMPYARTYEANITFPIPEGYVAEGVDALQQSETNVCGKFIVTANVDNNTLKVSIVKEYSHAFEASANWTQLLKIIDLSNDFFNKNIMLKKK